MKSKIVYLCEGISIKSGIYGLHRVLQHSMHSWILTHNHHLWGSKWTDAFTAASQ